MEDGAFVAQRSQERKLWQILDICMGGLAFRYIPIAQEIIESSKLEIVTSDTLFSLENIPYRSISECEISEESLSKYSLKRHSVQFGYLTDDQKSELKYFILNHTVSEL
ncbi:hypothetical protein ACFL4N_05465 [Thermodesulfobacteriota bacterium]